MGETYTKLTVYGPERTEELRAIVDSGSTFTKIPVNIGVKLGLKPIRKLQVRLSDGSIVGRDLCFTEAELDGVKGPIPLTLAKEEETPLIGYTTLEILGFKINPVTGKLETTTPIEY